MDAVGHATAGGASPAAASAAASELASAEAALRKLGYRYNDSLKLRNVVDDTPFAFVNQEHNEKLALAVAAYVQALLLSRHGLCRRLLNGVDVYASPEVDTAPALLVLLCGAGAVSAGQWARRLCINESLRTGAVFPYVEWAQSQGLAVLVLNPNHRGGPGSERHVVQAFDTLVSPAVQHIVMVAHSYGGVCTAALLAARGEAVTSRLRAVALTDSVHGRSVERMPAPQREWFARQCRNWVTSETPLDTLVRPAVHQPPEEDEQAEDNEHDDAHRFDPPSSSDDDVDAKDGADARPHAASALKRRKTRSFWAPPWCDAARVSAGVTVHEETSKACRPSACRFLLEQLRAAGWAPSEGGVESGAAGTTASAAAAQ